MTITTIPLDNVMYSPHKKLSALKDYKRLPVAFITYNEPNYARIGYICMLENEELVIAEIQNPGSLSHSWDLETNRLDGLASEMKLLVKLYEIDQIADISFVISSGRY